MIKSFRQSMNQRKFSQYIMFHEERLPNIGIRLRLGDKEELMHIDLQINPAGEINLNQLIALIRQTYHLEPHLLFFYLNHSRGTFEFIDQDQLLSVHFTSLISENLITFKLEHRLSDEILANPNKYEQDSRTKRSRERIIEQAFVQVEQWRYFYREGCLNQHGVKMKFNLDQSAEIVGVPRKTLQDYFLLFRTGKSLEFDFKKERKEKIGLLRSYIKERGKKPHSFGKEIDEKKFFRDLRFEMLGEKPEEELFDILKSNRSHSSSDQDMVFQH